MKKKRSAQQHSTPVADKKGKISQSSVVQAYIWGFNVDHQLGVDVVPQDGKVCNKEEEVDGVQSGVPLLLHFPETVSIKNISLGSRHSLCLTSEGKIYSWGWGATGQLGQNDLSTRETPTLVSYFESKSVASISAGGCHSGCITDASEIYTWGLNTYGQLGLGKAAMDDGIVPYPQQVMFENGQALLGQKLSCGGMHSAVLSSGQVYCFGRADSGQLGIGDAWLQQGKAFLDGAATSNMETELGVPAPVLVTGVSNVKHVVTGAFHTAAITQDGALYTWGKEDYGMLGVPNQDLLKDGVWRPHHVPKPEALKTSIFLSVACGGWHTAVVAGAAEGPGGGGAAAAGAGAGAWACGRGEYGRLGVGGEASRPTLAPVALRPSPPAAGDADSGGVVVKKVAAGGTHTLFLGSDGDLYACGRGDYGRLGLGKNLDTQEKPVLLDFFHENNLKVIDISCGGSHSAALVIQQQKDTHNNNGSTKK